MERNRGKGGGTITALRGAVAAAERRKLTKALRKAHQELKLLRTVRLMK